MDASTLDAARRQRVTVLIGECSIELSPRDELAGEALRELIAPGTTVFVNHAAERHAPRYRRRLLTAPSRGICAGAACRGASAGKLDPGQRFPPARRGRGGRRAHPADRRRRQPGGAVPRQPRSAGDRRGGASRHRSCRVRRLPRGPSGDRGARAGCGVAGQGRAGPAARARRVAGDAVRLRSRADPALDRGAARAGRGLSGDMSASPVRRLWQRWRSSRSAAASVRRCAHWRGAIRRSRASWRRPGRMH